MKLKPGFDVFEGGDALDHLGYAVFDWEAEADDEDAGPGFPLVSRGSPRVAV